MWAFFLPGEKQNSAHTCAHCLGCIEKHRPSTAAIELNAKGNAKMPLVSDTWVVEGMCSHTMTSTL